jgi:cysteine desulfurase
MRGIYMDANATTPLLEEVVDAMRPWWAAEYGNASSIHQAGQAARAAVDEAREKVGRLLGCRAAEVVFTSGGTESDNLAVFGVVQPWLDAGEQVHVVTTAIEHHAVLYVVEALERRGVEVTWLRPAEDGRVAVEDLKVALRAETRLVSVMLANNETGVVQPVREMAAAAHAAGAVFHTDAVQGVAKLAVDMKEELADVDLLSLAGHKMYGPQGTGALFVRKGVKLAPMFFGGLHERGRRAGTENVAGIVGLGRAAEAAQAWLADGGSARLAGLRERLEAAVLARVGDAGVNGAGAARVANTVNFWFAGVDAEALVIALDLQGLAISGGSACQSGATEPSHVLRAMGLSEARAHGSVRVSLLRGVTVEEIDRAAAMLGDTVERLRGIG